MSIPMVSQERFVLTSLTEQVHHLLEQESVEYSLGVEFGVAELVRVQMRQLATAKWERELVILGRSMQLAQEKLTIRCDQCNLTYDFTPYFSAVQKELRFVAREMSELSQQLELSRQSGRVATRETMEGRTAIPIELVQVGLQNAIAALLVIPLAEEFELNLAEAGAAYELEGEWFPYQVGVDEFNMVLDDDGTILVSTVNLSDERIQQAKESLLNLAEHLYAAWGEDVEAGAAH